MEKSKKIKITISLFYLIVISSFLYFFLTRFTLQELTTYEFIKNNRNFFFNLKQSNLILLSLIFLLSTIFWVFMAGFGSPVILLGGFIFGKWIGFIIVILGLSIGSTLLYIFGNYFLKDFIKDKFLTRFKKLEIKFKKSEFFYLLLYRFIGGIPFALSNVLPCIFNVKAKNFFWATLLGIIPQAFLIASVGSGLEKIIAQNLEAPKIVDLIYSPDIYVPMLAFVGLIILTIIARKIFYKK
jgi:uncharacterized membrane protein YdjX (TVP38/TMEM64 family)|tara:strand:- start:145 stop:864 length:720 start_codon:yes stop_codon:yes gene_type:complete